MENDHKQNIIFLDRVGKRYKTGAGEVTVLKDISLQVQTGEFLSVVGPSGSGKSTLLNMITGIDRPSAGEVIVDGQILNKLGENRIARWRGRTIGVIFQFFQLLPTLTILENVLLPMDFCKVFKRRERIPRAMYLLEEVGIVDHAHKLPRALSGGEQQRAAIARALATDPPIVIADEPTGNLDTSSAAGVFTLFQDLVAQGKTLLIVTHDTELSSKTARVVHLLDGQISRDAINLSNLDSQVNTASDETQTIEAQSR